MSWCNYKSINNYLIKRIRLSTFIDPKCFLRFNKYKIVEKRE